MRPLLYPYCLPVHPVRKKVGNHEGTKTRKEKESEGERRRAKEREGERRREGTTKALKHEKERKERIEENRNHEGTKARKERGERR